MVVQRGGAAAALEARRGGLCARKFGSQASIGQNVQGTFITLRRTHSLRDGPGFPKAVEGDP